MVRFAVTGKECGMIDATIADATLDRLLHHAHRLTLKGESLRRPGKPPKIRPDPDTIVTD
jgi:DNA replication protein DnaC